MDLCRRLQPAGPARRRPHGFTLIEVMIAVAIIGILTAVALPAYRNYMVRGKLVEGVNGLAALRTQMEQYYQDNRQYTNVSGTILSPCNSSTTSGSFTITCSNLTTVTYKLTATGSGLSAGAVYSVDNSNAQSTDSFPTGWGSVPSSHACYLMRKGDSC